MNEGQQLRISFSIDVEVDMGNRSKEYFGVVEGLPRFLRIFDQFGVSADFFVTSDVCSRFHKEVRNLQVKNHNIGNHGLNHRPLCGMGYERQYQWLRESTRRLGDVLEDRPRMFRAPNFGADGNTIKALEKLDYVVDSSVMPGRVLRRFDFDPVLWKFFATFRKYDFTSAPQEIYRPSPKGITQKGRSKVVEIPLSENPFRKGCPISLGFLNKEGLEKTIRAIERARKSYVIFLCHSWELIDLGTHYEGLAERFKKECSSRTEILEEFLAFASRKWEISTLEGLFDDYLAR